MAANLRAGSQEIGLDYATPKFSQFYGGNIGDRELSPNKDL